jgi:hypothetical protein
VIDAQHQTAISPGSCPAPRVGATLVPNFNGFSTAFASQIFLLLGNFNSSIWEDSNGLAQGEVVSCVFQNFNEFSVHLHR